MQKFTVFTAILTVIIVVVVAEILVSEYFPSLKAENEINGQSAGFVSGVDLGDATAANLFNSALESDAAQQLGDAAKQQFANGIDAAVTGASDYLGGGGSGQVLDFEDQGSVAAAPNVFLDNEKLTAAGFYNAFLEEEEHKGLLFKNIFVEDLNGVSMTKYAIRNKEQMLAKVYVLQGGPGVNSVDIHNLLKQRMQNTLNIEVNETNSFGDASFYMNDRQRDTIAFLMTRIGNQVFGFSYPKDFHQQISNLIGLLDLEF